jgi:hypothetical protein
LTVYAAAQFILFTGSISPGINLPAGDYRTSTFISNIGVVRLPRDGTPTSTNPAERASPVMPT